MRTLTLLFILAYLMAGQGFVGQALASPSIQDVEHSSPLNSDPKAEASSDSKFVTMNSAFLNEKFTAPSAWIFSGARLALDLGVKNNTRLDGEISGLNEFIGLDFYTELQTPTRHWGSMVIQFYGFRMDQFQSLNPSEEGGRFAYSPCIIAPNIILLPQGQLNFKIGHIS